MEKFVLEVDEKKNMNREDVGTLDHVKDNNGDACYSGKINMLLLNKMYEVFKNLIADETCFVIDEKLSNNKYLVTFENKGMSYKTIIENKDNKMKLEFLQFYSDDGYRRRYKFSFNDEECIIQENKNYFDFDVKDNYVCDFFDMFNISYFNHALLDCKKKYELLKTNKQKNSLANKNERNITENKYQEEQNRKQDILKNKLSGF